MDQIDYAGNLRRIVHPQLISAKLEDLCCPELHQLYMSLLGAVAYPSHTRIDIVVFICAGQRYSSKPQVQHVRRLNKLLTGIQRNPMQLIYKKLTAKADNNNTHLRIVSDAAYKCETEDGYSLRGALYCRGIGTSAESFVAQRTPIHIVD